ncbi:hypothetical protein F9C07_4726 [Aspergillus flavus]|uniref:Uncharacterized protein n=1 Tax=Aspergillus flavus (strain ATCC 200026 / FGSC A1120 / IAM 13836 / NRRL 3357 / JCM 12722 / SRRC 167) TaxID=332952 RepID=A0A7U2ML49_ASPFN|nr:hypothetical protein F9C07_4726 [Aspergillus flavus]GMF79111.1 unnamed protein product [Aspergillus oryzae]
MHESVVSSIDDIWFASGQEWFTERGPTCRTLQSARVVSLMLDRVTKTSLGLIFQVDWAIAEDVRREVVESG